MHVKSKSEHLKQDRAKSRTPTTMASYNDEDSTNNNNNNNTNTTSNTKGNNNNNNNNDDSKSLTSSSSQPHDPALEVKKLALEQRKQELEKLLNEKNWQLQQFQKYEVQALNGIFETVDIHELSAKLMQQCKEQPTQQLIVEPQEDDSITDASILRRKATPTAMMNKENQNHVNNNHNSVVGNNRQSEISNRSSEYDNYPASGISGGMGSIGSGDSSSLGKAVELNASYSAGTQQYPNSMPKNAFKKRVTPAPTPTPSVAAANIATMPPAATSNFNYIKLQRQQQQILQQQMQLALAQQQQQNHQQLQHQQQQQQQRLLQQQQHHSHFHQQKPQQQLPQPQQRLFITSQQQLDAISLYSVNSANVATLRQPHHSPQQQPIVVQCDKYYLSPTQQTFNDGGGFIRSSQNIKKCISPTPQTYTVAAGSYEKQAMPLKQLQPHNLHPHHHPHHLQQQQRQLDTISLAPSYASIDWPPSIHGAQAGTMHGAQPGTLHHHNQVLQSPSNDTLRNTPPIAIAGLDIDYFPQQSAALSPKSPHYDEISIASFSTDTQKKPKSRQWLESSLDGPAIQPPYGGGDESSYAIEQSARLPHKFPQASNMRERSKLSSQSMSSGRHYSMSNQKHPHASKLLQDDDGRYAKLSQSTSYLNSIETMSSISPAYPIECISKPIELPSFKYLPPKPNAANNKLPTPTPPPRPRQPPPVPQPSHSIAAPTEKPLHLPAPTPLASTAAVTNAAVASSAAIAAAAVASLSPDIRLESPKNMTVVKPATFQPYKEVTKPFEMSDFYKYSTKFRQKENASTTNIGNSEGVGNE